MATLLQLATAKITIRGVHKRGDEPMKKHTLYQIQTRPLSDRPIWFWAGTQWSRREDDAEAYETYESAQTVLTELAKHGAISQLAYVQPFTALEVLPTKTLCCWCDELATGKPVRYAGTSHPACPTHSEKY